MKNRIKIIILCFLIIPSICIKSQNTDRQYDSIMVVMKNKSIPLLERYYMTGDIEYFSSPHKIGILKELIPEAKLYEDKAVITRLYSLISLFYTHQSDYTQAKLYCDSAFRYENKFENNAIHGTMYFNRGVFYSFQYKMSEAHSDYYKAAEYFNKDGIKRPILNDVYYNLSVLYSLKNDDKALKELSGWLEEVPAIYPIHLINRDELKSAYFIALYQKNKEIAQLDSVIAYNQHAIDIYSQSDEPYDVGYQISNCYITLANVYNTLGKHDLAKTSIQKAKGLVNPSNLNAKIRLTLTSAQLHFSEKEYSDAEKELLEGLNELRKLSLENNIDYYNLLATYNSVLSQVYEKQGRYEEALSAERKGLEYEQLLFDRNNNETVLDMKSKYDLDNKQRLVDQLTEINEINKRSRYLYWGIGASLICILLLIIVRYRSKQKINASRMQVIQLKKEEAELNAELEKEKALVLSTKIEEKDQAYQLLLSENKLKQVNSYLEGLEAERLRLSKELHDNISNQLVSIDMMLENKNKSEISDMLQQIQGQVRNISHELIPPVFQQATLSEILIDFVRQQNQLKKSEVTIEFDDNQNKLNALSQNISLEIYRIVQEAVGNSVKHAQARQINIKLSYQGKNLKLEINDNGKGFDTEVKHKGIGLLIIKERVESLKGKLSIHSVHDAGTEITVDIALDSEVS